MEMPDGISTDMSTQRKPHRSSIRYLAVKVPLFSSPLKQTRFFARRDHPTTQFLVRRFSHHHPVYNRANDGHIVSIVVLLEIFIIYRVIYGIRNTVARLIKSSFNGGLIWRRAPLTEV